LYADDTSLIITNSDSQMFKKDINTAIIWLNRRFNSNLLLLNLENTYFVQFLTKKTNVTDLHFFFPFFLWRCDPTWSWPHHSWAF
jgi:hypothetical protein